MPATAFLISGLGPPYGLLAVDQILFLGRTHSNSFEKLRSVVRSFNKKLSRFGSFFRKGRFGASGFGKCEKKTHRDRTRSFQSLQKNVFSTKNRDRTSSVRVG